MRSGSRSFAMRSAILSISARFSASAILLVLTSHAIATSARCIQLIAASESSSGGSSSRRNADSRGGAGVDAGAALAAFGDFARARLATPTTLFVVGAARQGYPAEGGAESSGYQIFPSALPGYPSDRPTFRDFKYLDNRWKTCHFSGLTSAAGPLRASASRGLEPSIQRAKRRCGLTEIV